MLLQTFISLTTLGLAHLAAAKKVPIEPTIGRACGFKIAPCPYDQECVPESPKCKNINLCPGTCQWKNQYSDCGGYRIKPKNCRRGQQCVDDPRLPGSCGMACDIPGICISKTPDHCGGFAGFECPEGLYCYEDPNDDCDPAEGGADCFGICL